MLYMKKFLSLLLVLGLLGSSQVALAAEESPAPLPGWSHSILADGYSLGLFGDEISVQHSQTVTMEQAEALARTVGDKLALLGSCAKTKIQRTACASEYDDYEE